MLQATTYFLNMGFSESLQFCERGFDRKVAPPRPLPKVSEVCCVLAIKVLVGAHNCTDRIETGTGDRNIYGGGQTNYTIHEIPYNKGAWATFRSPSPIPPPFFLCHT